MMRSFLLHTEHVQLRRTDKGQVVLISDDRDDGSNGSEQTAVGVGSVLSCFPLSSPSTLVSIRDEDGREVGILTDIKNLDAESQGVLQEELERSYFMPRITDIYAIEEDLNINTWKVETTRGPRVFQTRAERKSIRRMGGNYLVIRDVDGNRYEVRNWARLSPKARSYIESFI